jgi:hypothetical protein
MSGGWTAVDPVTNKSIPITGTNAGGAVAPYVMPSPMQQDAVGKMRISQPTSLIDTDFEYGPQPSKWESVNLQNNRPTQYYDPQAPLTVTSVTPSSGTRFISVVGTFVVPANSLVYIQNSVNNAANGWGFTASGGTNGMTVVSANTQNSNSNVFNTAGTYVYVGYNYSLSGIPVGANVFSTNGTTTVTVSTSGVHGLSPGSLIYILNTSSTSNSINGPQVVVTTPTTSTFTFTNSASVTSFAVTNSSGSNVVFARSAGSVESRPYDGGVTFTAGSIGVGQQLIRQTRRYFRYQSGKSVQFSTGTSLCPSLFVTSITSSGTTATVTTRFPHNLSTNCTVVVTGCDQGPYNGTFRVATVTSETTFTYTMSGTAALSPATGFPQRVNPINWGGASNRVGMFDQQNGMFFEYDGQTLFTVWRSSVLQLSGTVTVTQSSNIVSGTGTQFSTQLDVGDFIVIRGQTYRVIGIASNTTLRISPDYRGTTISSPSYALVSKTIDTRIPQSQWNLDRCDGTGPSGYRIDLTRMQMLYMDYSWYGAGTIRWGVRATNGQIIWCHQQQNNNRQYEAYLRSGNLPAHYESNGIVGYSGTSDNASSSMYLPGTNYSMTAFGVIGQTATTMTIFLGSSYLPNTGVISLGTAPNNEFVFYASRSGNTLNGCVRGLPGGVPAREWPSSVTSVVIAGITIRNTYGFPATGGNIRVSSASFGDNTFTWAYTNIFGNTLYGSAVASGLPPSVSTTSPALVEYASADTAAPLSHWGSSVIMDGGFDDDKSLVFNYGTTTAISLNAGTTVPILAIRLAPSVDNGRIGIMGDKETLNRGQLQLLDMAAVSSGAVLINLILNGYTTSFSGAFSPVNIGTTVTSSLAQVAVNTSNTASITGGESVTALYSNGVNTIDLSQVRDLANSILGGGSSNVVPTLASRTNVYPDGPDVMYVVATNTTGGAVTLLARLNWKEAQA